MMDKAINLQSLTPPKAIHPGIILKREIEKRGIKQRELSTDLGIAATQLNDLIKGKRNISAEMAILLEAALNIEAIFWMNLQATYEIHKARQNASTTQKAQILKDWKIIKQHIPFSYFRKEKILVDDKAKDINTILGIYDLSIPSDITKGATLSGVQKFRKSSTHKVDEVNIRGWWQYVRYLAKQQKVKSFDFNKEEQLLTKVKQLFWKNNILENIAQLLSQYGIIFIVQKKPDKVPVDGVAFWIDNHPVVAVTLRYKRLDNLAFTILHELGHIFLHLKQNTSREFIDDMESGKNNEAKEESEANTYAENHLIASDSWKQFMQETESFNSDAIKMFAQKIDIHPAIILGRLKKEQNEFYRRRFSIDNTIR